MEKFNPLQYFYFFLDSIKFTQFISYHCFGFTKPIFQKFIKFLVLRCKQYRRLQFQTSLVIVYSYHIMIHSSFLYLILTLEASLTNPKSSQIYPPVSTGVFHQLWNLPNFIWISYLNCDRNFFKWSFRHYYRSFYQCLVR